MISAYEMAYNPKRKRWAVEIEGQFYELHLGDGFDLFVGYYCLNCTIELNGRHWYLIMGCVHFQLKKKEKYRVIL